MMIIQRILTTAAAMVLLVAFNGALGCASPGEADGDARETAALLHAQVVDLRAEVRRKMDAERRYYNQTVETLARLQFELDETAAAREYIERSRALADGWASSASARAPDAAIEDLIDAANVVATGQAERVARIASARENLDASLAALDGLDQRYAALEKALVVLRTPPESSDRLRHLADFLKRGVDHFNELRDQNGDAAADEG